MVVVMTTTVLAWLEAACSVRSKNFTSRATTDMLLKKIPLLARPPASKVFWEEVRSSARRTSPLTMVVGKVDKLLIHDVNPSQLGEAQWCISPISWLREALLAARRGPVVHRATNKLLCCC